jgi:hypothetical protein
MVSDSSPSRFSHSDRAAIAPGCAPPSQTMKTAGSNDFDRSALVGAFPLTHQMGAFQTFHTKFFPFFNALSTKLCHNTK